MIQREFRPTDVPRLVELLRDGFPQEEALFGMQPQQLVEVTRRLYRWDARLLLGVLRGIGRPVYRFLVVEEDGGLAATTLLTFPPRTGWVSMVAVDPAFRRRGFARRLLERAQELARRAGKGYVALDVLRDNAPAIALYTSMGYRTLRTSTILAREMPLDLPAPPPPSGATIRPFAKQDARRLVEIATRTTPAPVAEVLPTRERALTGGAWANRLLTSESAAWVVDRGDGAEAYVSATLTPATQAAHLATPIVGPNADDTSCQHLLRTALSWLESRGAPRVVVLLPEANVAGRRPLLDAGFRDALALLTLYRSTS